MPKTVLLTKGGHTVLDSYFYGSQRLLRKLPISVTGFILMIFTTDVLYPGREILEGIPYNVSYASLLADVGLGLVIVIGAEIFKDDHLVKILMKAPRGFIYSKGYHVLVLLVAACVAALLEVVPSPLNKPQVMDIYHNIVVVPLFMYLLATTYPAIVSLGNMRQRRFAFWLLMLWAAAMVFDMATDRLAQRPWLERHGMHFSELHNQAPSPKTGLFLCLDGQIEQCILEVQGFYPFI